MMSCSEQDVIHCSVRNTFFQWDMSYRRNLSFQDADQKEGID